MSSLPSTIFAVATRSHNATGYWGSSEDVTHTFCEPHYATTFYVAEFYNSLSSLVYVVTGWYVLRTIGQKDRFVWTGAVWLMVIGIGSALFHGIMWYWMQLLDEIPMVGFAATIMLAKVENPALQRGTRTLLLLLLRVLVWTLCVGTALVYTITQQYEIFIHGFTAIVVLDIGLVFWTRSTGAVCPRHGALHLRAFLTGVGTIVVGKTLWEVENRLCETHRDVVWPLHVVWHFFSATAAYSSLVATYLLGLTENEESKKNMVLFSQEERPKAD